MPVGPQSLGGYTLIQLGRVAIQVFPKTKNIDEMAGVILYSVGIMSSLLLWGFALLWLFLAVAAIYHCRRFPLAWVGGGEI
jgi:hypothetical protein